MQSVQIVKHVLNAARTNVPAFVVELEEPHHRHRIECLEHQIHVRDQRAGQHRRQQCTHGDEQRPGAHQRRWLQRPSTARDEHFVVELCVRVGQFNWRGLGRQYQASVCASGAIDCEACTVRTQAIDGGRKPKYTTAAGPIDAERGMRGACPTEND